MPDATVRLFDSAEPALPPGTYTVKVTQRVAAAGGGETFRPKAPFRFEVAAPRFSLRPDDIYAIYPPAGQSGNFHGCLPHVVFTRCTLPWEHATAAGQPTSPWMALLLLTPEDGLGDLSRLVVARKVGDLTPPPVNEASAHPRIEGPNVGPAPGEEGDLCFAIDLPAQLLLRIAPTVEERSLLAHVREVQTGSKETLSLQQDGLFSIVIGHRVPAASGVHLACLVSLEGFEGLLSKRGAAAAPSTVRLAVLAHWSFTAAGNDDFKSIVNALDVGPFALAPAGSAEAMALAAQGEADADAVAKQAQAAVASALAFGFAPLNHTMRLGEKTVTWYRGPLVPLDMFKRAVYDPISCADALLRFDPRCGLFVAEYAAAFELGRLLALQNRAFTAAIARHRVRVAQELLARRQRASRAALFDEETPKTQDTFDPPAEATRFFARALLLYGVPFGYLVPDPRLLPPESIRWFYLDPGWINAMLQGAVAIGRGAAAPIDPAGRAQLIYETMLLHRLLDCAMDEAVTVRAADPIAGEPVRARTVGWPITGVLIRSRVVKGWQGLEVRAFTRSGDEEVPAAPMSAARPPAGGTQATVPLVPLRIDRLAPDVMLALFDGEIVDLHLKQPAEGLHFDVAHGVGETAAGAVVARLGDWAKGSAALAARLVTRPVEAVFPLRD